MSYLYHLEHPNILPLLTSYTYNGIPNFLVPLAEGGDLEHLLMMKTRPREFVEDTSLYRALSGLASALETLHGYKSDILSTEMIGYHHDLKPKNVLLASDRFVLSDFGLSKLKAGEDSRTPFRVGQGYYLAPECEDSDNGFTKGTVSRASDVWSLGCIILEVVVFMIGGSDGLSAFRDRRKFRNGFLITKTFFCGRSINPAVAHQLSELIDCEDIMLRRTGDLLRCILVMNSLSRLKASEVALRLRHISCEASYLKVCATFASTEWRFNDPKIRKVWNRVCERFKYLAIGGNENGFPSTGIEIPAPFLDTSFVSKLLIIIDSLLNHMTAQEPLEDISPKLLSTMLQLQHLLGAQRELSHQGRNMESISINQSNISPKVTAPDNVRNLEWNDYSLLAATGPSDCSLLKQDRLNEGVTVSGDESLIAVESDWKISIYVLSSGKKIQEIKAPTDTNDYLERKFSGERPACRFFPKANRLLICWGGLKVCVHKVGFLENEFSTIFSTLQSNTGSSIGSNNEIIQGPISLVTISLDSRKVALAPWIGTRSSGLRRYIRVIGVADNEEASSQELGRLSIHQDEKVFEFSPDGRLLAATNQRIERRNGRSVVDVRLINVSQTRFTSTWARLLCEKHPQPAFVPVREDRFLSIRPCRLKFRIWRGRWVAAVWDPSHCIFRLHDLFSLMILESLDFSSPELSKLSVQAPIFSGDLKFALSYRVATGGAFLRGLINSRNKKTLNDSVIIFETGTRRVVCVLQCAALDDCWLSESGNYLIVRKNEELRVFGIQRD